MSEKPVDAGGLSPIGLGEIGYVSNEAGGLLLGHANDDAIICGVGDVERVARISPCQTGPK